MQAHYFPYTLKLKHPFGIFGNIRTETPVVFIILKTKTFYGIGEASLPPYLPYNQQSVITCFKEFTFANYSLNTIENLFQDFKKQNAYCPPAIAALNIAINDLKGKILNQPVWKLLKVTPEKMPPNSFTIGIDTPDVIEKKVNEAIEFKTLKVKVGSDNDKLLINTIRKITDKPLIVDANQGLRNQQQALEFCRWLYDKNCLLIEQPLKKDNLQGHAYLSEHSPIPIIADESFQGNENLDEIKNYFNGINIKLMKCGGLTNGHQLAINAREKGLKILMGCMNESSCANLAAAQIAPLADWVDLDGPYLINNNPFEDFKMEEGTVLLDNKPGLGLVLKNIPEFNW